LEDDVLALPPGLQGLDLGVGALEGLARFFRGGNVHHGADVLDPAARLIVDGLRDDVQVLTTPLDIRRQCSRLQFSTSCVTRSMLGRGSIFGMDS
jgi:hypothetical protein